MCFAEIPAQTDGIATLYVLKTLLGNATLHQEGYNYTKPCVYFNQALEPLAGIFKNVTQQPVFDAAALASARNPAECNATMNRLAPSILKMLIQHQSTQPPQSELNTTAAWVFLNTSVLGSNANFTQNCGRVDMFTTYDISQYTDCANNYRTKLNHMLLSLKTRVPSLLEEGASCPNLITSASIRHLTYELYKESGVYTKRCSANLACLKNSKQNYRDHVAYAAAWCDYFLKWCVAIEDVHMASSWTAMIFKCISVFLIIIYALRSYVLVGLRVNHFSQSSYDTSFDSSEFGLNVPRWGATFWAYLYSTATLGSSLIGYLVYFVVTFVYCSTSIHVPEYLPHHASTRTFPELVQSMRDGPIIINWIGVRVVLLVTMILIHVLLGEFMARFCGDGSNPAGSARIQALVRPKLFAFMYVPYAVFSFGIAYELMLVRFALILVFAFFSLFQMQFTILPKALASFDSAYASLQAIACQRNLTHNPLFLGTFTQWLFDIRERRFRCSEEDATVKSQRQKRMRISNRLWLAVMLTRYPILRRYRKASARCSPNEDFPSEDCPSSESPSEVGISSTCTDTPPLVIIV